MTNSIKDNFSLVQRLVEGYGEHGYSLEGPNISIDRYYTSIPLTKWLHEKIITSIFYISKLVDKAPGLNLGEK